MGDTPRVYLPDILASSVVLPPRQCKFAINPWFVFCIQPHNSPCVAIATSCDQLRHCPLVDARKNLYHYKQSLRAKTCPHSIAWHRKRCILRAICTQNTYFHIARYMHGLPVARNMRGVHYEYILRAICATFIIYRGHVQMLRNERKLGLAYCAQSARSVNHAHIPRNMHMTELGPIKLHCARYI